MTLDAVRPSRATSDGVWYWATSQLPEVTRR